MPTKELQKRLDSASDELMERLRESYASSKGWETAGQYILGLLSGTERKNGWQLAEQLGERTPYRLQQFLYRGAWAEDSVRNQLRDYVCEHLGEENAILVVEETGFLKQGRHSAGVKRQYNVTSGRVENCQIGVFLTYASQKGYGIIDRALYLPEEWTEDTKRRQKVGVPEEVTFQTKAEQALTMLRSAQEAGLPFAWVTGDNAYGNPSGIRNYLEHIGKQYVLAVSEKAFVCIAAKQIYVSKMIADLPDTGWQQFPTENGIKGDKCYDWISLPLPCEADGFEKCFLVRRSVAHPEKQRGYLCFCKAATPLSALVRVADTRWASGKCFSNAKSDIGFDHYEVRSWQGWYRHITLAMCAHALVSVLQTEMPYAGISSFFAPKTTGDSLGAFKKGRNLGEQP